MGSVGGFCYICFNKEEFFTVLFKGPAFGLCYSLNYDHAEAFCGECVMSDPLHNLCQLLLLTPYCHSVLVI